MRLTLRFVVPLLLTLGAFAYAAVPLADALMLRWFVRDLDMRSSLIANTVQAPLVPLLDAASPARITTLFNGILRDERLYAIGVCLPGRGAAIATANFPRELDCGTVRTATTASVPVLRSPHGLLHIAVRPLVATAPPDEGADGADLTDGPGRNDRDRQVLAHLVLVHDMSFVERRNEETRRYLFLFFAALSASIALLTVVVAQLSWRGWVQGLRALLRGEGILRPARGVTAPELRPIARDLRELILDLERQYRPLDGSQRIWDQDALRATLRSELHGNDVIVVANREPYIHTRGPDGIVLQRPASGLVTALEPVMRACSGTWIAHGSGSADRDVVDRHDRVAVPPDHPLYQLRRLWLSADEESGYYSGFANEGLWPLCHIAHVRPIFRASDFEHYRRVNARFADAVAAEAQTADPVVLVQDYHFALLPRLIRDRLPAATIITFWHIPWPNPEAFAICPWRRELLDGLLGSSILGFHTRFHCNNFLDTVDRLLEARVERESSTIHFRGHATMVKSYPISIEWPPAPLAAAKDVATCRRDVRAALGLPEQQRLAVGVDRLDYTKGVVERFQAVARLMELEPRWIGRFTLVQIAAPTRGVIPEYRHYAERVAALAEEINGRYSGGGNPPIRLLFAHHEPDAVYEHLRAADLCLVTSLHDGMNLVAKEFVAARDDEQGVLVLSQFTGAARELAEALIVNPYDAEQCARALHAGLTMPPAEQRDRMRMMRGVVRQSNVFRWAGRMLLDAALLRQRSRFRIDAGGGFDG